jgi:Tfp pilus assembly protein PilF
LFIRTKLSLLTALCVAAGAAGGAPRVPHDDAEVLERLPLRRGDPVAVELRQLRGAALARRYFELALGQGDPRYVGYAEAALRNAQGDPPGETLFVRGLLKQYRHDFPGALADLEAALKHDPGLAGAHSWRAAIFLVGADYRAAREECRALEPLASDLIAIGCRASVDAATGKARAAYDALKDELERRADAPPGLRLWALTRLGEFAARLGDSRAAERHFRAALALGERDDYLLAAYADLLLEQKRAREVSALLGTWGTSDNLLLRAALAAKMQNAPGAPKLAQALGERFAAAGLRGERLHLAEEARYLLELKGEPNAALAAAAENWRSQREPRDAAVLLEAALAAGDRKAALPALRWLDESGLEDVRLQRLAAQLR